MRKEFESYLINPPHETNYYQFPVHKRVRRESVHNIVAHVGFYITCNSVHPFLETAIRIMAAFLMIENSSQKVGEHTAEKVTLGRQYILQSQFRVDTE